MAIMTVNSFIDELELIEVNQKDIDEFLKKCEWVK
jgi:hypothetical protein